jgi:hypothetical protein
MKRKMTFTAVASIALMLCLLVSNTGAAGQDPQPPAHGQPLVGTWDVTLRFPVCSATCQCPGGVPNIPLPALHTYSNDGTMEEMSGGSLFRSDARGSWEHVRDHQYAARYKFFVFNAAGMRILTEVVTSQIQLQGHDAFDATATFDRSRPTEPRSRIPVRSTSPERGSEGGAFTAAPSQFT